jgi:hypothetical protein
MGDRGAEVTNIPDEFPPFTFTTRMGVATPTIELRDYFAAQAQALVGMIAGASNDLKHPDEEAFTAYVYADAMLRAREAK